MNKHLLANIRFYFAQSVFMNNCHYKAYNRLEQKKALNSKIVAVFSIITIILLILQIIGFQNDLDTLIKTCAFIGLVLTGASLIFSMINNEDISLLLYQHKNTAEKYKTIRDSFMSLIEEVMSNNTDENRIKEKRDLLLNKYSAIGEFAPSTTYSDYEAAQNSLGIAPNTNEEFTWNNLDIDRFLPTELRIGE